ncbi:hypothetical protein A3Q56_00140 [Intoshia linei]|uniref:BTBD10/KCTD20 BTB/POZ domain-containing protein n=1 Tax=Intoshia linei TaxID=1819745 RepID=A0A177BD44_9BILA|nr:hypothetical protein A3Q56_00140 [Intoshia linei]
MNNISDDKFDNVNVRSATSILHCSGKSSENDNFEDILISAPSITTENDISNRNFIVIDWFDDQTSLPENIVYIIAENSKFRLDKTLFNNFPDTMLSKMLSHSNTQISSDDSPLVYELPIFVNENILKSILVNNSVAFIYTRVACSGQVSSNLNNEIVLPDITEWNNF